MGKILIGRNWIKVDFALEELINLINSSKNWRTLSSCSGHKIYHPSVMMENKEGDMFEFFTRIKIFPIRKKIGSNCNIDAFYKQDDNHISYNPYIEDFYNNNPEFKGLYLDLRF